MESKKRELATTDQLCYKHTKELSDTFLVEALPLLVVLESFEEKPWKPTTYHFPHAFVYPQNRKRKRLIYALALEKTGKNILEDC